MEKFVLLCIFLVGTFLKVPNAQGARCSGGRGASRSDIEHCCEHRACSEGQGDCDNDNQCAGSLICGRNNCKSGFSTWSYADCCIQGTSVPSTLPPIPQGPCVDMVWNCAQHAGSCQTDAQVRQYCRLTCRLCVPAVSTKPTTPTTTPVKTTTAVVASCADGKQNQFETGIDCGGRCQVCRVICGSHRAANCRVCPGGNGAAWCNGDCMWNQFFSSCNLKATTATTTTTATPTTTRVITTRPTPTTTTTRILVPCTASTGCSAPKPICIRAGQPTSECIACTSNRGCVQPRSVCINSGQSNSMCVGCTQLQGCIGNPVRPFCTNPGKINSQCVTCTANGARGGCSTPRSICINPSTPTAQCIVCRGDAPGQGCPNINTLLGNRFCVNPGLPSSRCVQCTFNNAGCVGSSVCLNPNTALAVCGCNHITNAGCTNPNPACNLVNTVPTCQVCKANKGAPHIGCSGNFPVCNQPLVVVGLPPPPPNCVGCNGLIGTQGNCPVPGTTCGGTTPATAGACGFFS